MKIFNKYVLISIVILILLGVGAAILGFMGVTLVFALGALVGAVVFLINIIIIAFQEFKNEQTNL